MYYFEVIVDRNINQTFTYSYPTLISIGQVVQVNFIKSNAIGIVIKIISNHTKKKYQIKNITNIYKGVKFTDQSIKFIKFISEYNMIPLGKVFKCFLTKKISDIVYLTTSRNIKTKKLYKVTEYLNNNINCTKENLSYNTKIQSKTIEKLIEEDYIRDTKPKIEQITTKYTLKLNTEQNNIKLQIIQNKTKFTVHLIDGVTGSGKTSLYMKVVEEILNNNHNGQILILVPEIALVKNLITNIKQYFHPNNIITEWSSHLTEQHKLLTWQKIISQENIIIIGTRSALLLPYKNLKMIVIDEEHDTSFKDSNSSFNARDMAIMQAKIHNIPILLCSATPSLESYSHAQSQKYQYHKLSNRIKNATMPIIHLVDMKKTQMKSKNISQPLYEAIKNTIQKNHQVILFINKRGFSPIIICQTCGSRIQCKFCSSCLNYHKKNNITICHLCGYEEHYINFCKKCNINESLFFYGPGIEKIEEEIAKLFPDNFFLTLSSDTIKNNNILDTIEKIKKGKVDIIIGTQLISKGYHFPKLSLVGIINGDNNASKIDLRSSEKTFQILTQVIGRAGRENDIEGHAIIQTFQPNNNVMQSILKYDRDGLYIKELAERKNHNMPPYTRSSAIIFMGKDKKETLNFAHEAKKKLTINSKINILGPSISPIAKIRGKYRVRMFFVYERNFNIQEYIKNWIQKIYITKKIQINIDINPLDFN